MQEPPTHFDASEAPDHPGWYSWDLKDKTRFNAAVMGRMIMRPEGDKCRLRMFPEVRHTNLQDMIHGATTLSLIDISLFTGMHVLASGDAGFAVTVELSTQFVGAGNPDLPLDAVTEIVRETGRMLFMRGEVEQDENVIAAFSGIVRKAPGN